MNPTPEELKAMRYTVECQPMIALSYVDSIDINKCGAVANELFKLLKDRFNVDGAYQSDDLLCTLAMMVNNFGYEMDRYSENNNWVRDGFPEFCSLIGPNSGFLVRVIEREPVHPINQPEKTE